MSYSSLKAMALLSSYELREDMYEDVECIHLSLTMGILRGMNCLMVEVFRELLLVQTELQNVMLALQNKSAQIIKRP